MTFPYILKAGPLRTASTMNASLGTAARCNADGVVGKEGTNVARSIQHINWAALGANLASTLLFTLLLLSPFLWGAPVWHWLLAVAISLVLGIYFHVRRGRFEEPGPDADETRFPR